MIKETIIENSDEGIEYKSRNRRDIDLLNHIENVSC